MLSSLCNTHITDMMQKTCQSETRLLVPQCTSSLHTITSPQLPWAFYTTQLQSLRKECRKMARPVTTNHESLLSTNAWCERQQELKKKKKSLVGSALHSVKGGSRPPVSLCNSEPRFKRWQVNGLAVSHTPHTTEPRPTKDSHCTNIWSRFCLSLVNSITNAAVHLWACHNSNNSWTTLK